MRNRKFLAFMLLCAYSIMGALSPSANAIQAHSSQLEDSDRHKQLIQQMFPEATDIGDKTTDGSFPAWPVFQVTQIIGFAYESFDVLEFPGFSGEPMNFLVGVDSQGTLRGVDVLYHHEPIFMHGLGPQAFVDFLAQYPGHSLTENIVVGGSRHKRGNEATYFDGVTAATVTVVVANDTVLLSAMQLARERLEAFAQKPPARVLDDQYEFMHWEELVSRNLVQRWTLSREQVEAALGGPVTASSGYGSAPDVPDELTLHFAYLNPPTVGRNFLGDDGYRLLNEKLAPGEHAFALFSQGFYDYLPADFTPASTPDRIALTQNGLNVQIRDTNFVDIYGLGVAGPDVAPANLRIFRTRAQAGLDPSKSTQLRLTVEAVRNPLQTDTATFQAPEYHLPASFFEAVADATPAQPTPIWLRVWQSRVPQIATLCVALLVLSVAFAQQRRLATNAAVLRYFRVGFLTFTLLFIGFYAQGQLSVVNVFAVQLGLRDGFDLTVFLLDPVIFILWLYTFLSLFIVGRGLFCGWLCPFGVLQAFVAWLAARLHIRQWKISPGLHGRLIYAKYVALAALMGLAMVSLQHAEQGAELEPFKTAITLRFLREWPFVAYAALILGAGLFINKFYCRYLCPLGAGLAVLGRFRLLSLLPRRAECGSPCQLCAVKCETAAIPRGGEIDYNECVQCMECLVILKDENQCAPARVQRKRELKDTIGTGLAGAVQPDVIAIAGSPNVG